MIKIEKKKVTKKDQRQICAGDQRKICGFTLIEVIIAIFLITVGITAVLLLITKTLGAMSLSFSQLKAAYLAQEGIEVVRNIRDTNWIDPAITDWDNFLSKPGCQPVPGNPLNPERGQCPLWYVINYDTTAPTEVAQGSNNPLYLDGTDFYTHTGGTATPFFRHIEIDYIGDAVLDTTLMKVKSIVTWQHKGKDYEISAEEHLYNWR